MSCMMISRPCSNICMFVESVSWSMASNSSFRRRSLSERKGREETDDACDSSEER